VRQAILVQADFDLAWPFAADYMHQLWQAQGEVIFHRVPRGELRCASEILAQDAGDIDRLALFGVPLTLPCIAAFSSLREVAARKKVDDEIAQAAAAKDVLIYCQTSEGYWSESVSECAIALTICGLRRIPQLHQAIQQDQAPWNYAPHPDEPGQEKRGHQHCDDSRFVSGTVARKKIGVVGAGNIASRYARCMVGLGADVSAYDPFASEPCFHLGNVKKEWHLENLIRDVDIFAPMVPLTDSTRGMITAEMIDTLPTGCLVLLVTRAGICDMAAIRRRVLANEISLAADVFDQEPLPLDDPLLGRSNVVHTPHIAGRTQLANQRYAEKLAEQFLPRSDS
jgi:phosphoglycerate dehydrogenase-like enzyme